MEPILKVKDVLKAYDDLIAVNKISFEVNQGEIMGILGPNGAGKTSLIRMIMNINAPDKGKIELNLDTDNWQSRVGYLPEERGLYKEAKVKDILIFLGSLKGLSKKEALKEGEYWLDKFDLTDNLNDEIKELSKGMAQKVQFAACVLHKPKLLILDEPFSGLDPVSQDLMKEEIKGLAESGVAIMLSSHQMNLVEEVCDRIFLLDKGNKVLYDDLDSIKNQYGNYRARLQTNDSNLLEDWLNENDLILNYNSYRNNFNILLEDNIEPNKFIADLPAGINLVELEIKRISLHNIFTRVARGGLLDAKENI
ncbi:ATP-binding cassette domain-containing protein [Halanaerobiaceae bacterium Z-7014]|uniref:ATP-binding cassette domain-containing protein n=1 Tax=Halonatronomonas betaini TaxID=2778430 RepID=A0A931AQ13_9FIRM|nr:ATP-binding cassette domain-containing protein [Halonatronomonas betaini]